MWPAACALSAGLLASLCFAPLGAGQSLRLRKPPASAPRPRADDAGRPPTAARSKRHAPSVDEAFDPDAGVLDTLPSLSPPELSEAPWPPRHRSGVRLLPEDAWGVIEEDPMALSDLRLRGLGLRGSPRARVPPGLWPEEPASPAQVEREAFVAAVGDLCPAEIPEERVARMADAALSAASALGADPFLLIALAFHQSRCDARSFDSYGMGLTRINLSMHKRHVRHGEYLFGRPHQAGFTRDRMSLRGHAFRRETLLKPETNFFFAGLFLRMFEVECPAIDGPFASAPHRHPVSHVIYGDVVKSPLPESMILTARRRLLAYYTPREGGCESCDGALLSQLPRDESDSAPREAKAQKPVCGAPLGEDLISPLDGAPRIVIGVLGDAREHGTRIHAGVDLLAAVGEPVRAVQRGVVISAGVELKNRGLIDLPPERAAQVPLTRMGARGIFVRIEHENGLVSLYSHLSGYTVQVGDWVERGQRIGDVGRSGVQASDAHLHLGLFESGQVVDPLVLLRPYVLFAEP